MADEKDDWSDFPLAPEPQQPITLKPGAEAPNTTTRLPPGYGSTNTIAGQISGLPQLDKYQQAAVEDRKRLADAGYKFPEEGYSARLAKGAGFGWTDEINAALGAPIYMARHGTFNPVEGYRYGKAAQDLTLKKAEENTAGPLGMALEIGGGLGTAGGVLAGTQAATRSGPAAFGVNAAKGAGLGAVFGAGEAPTVSDIPYYSAAGGTVGGLVSAAAPVVGAAAGQVARIAQMPRLRDPQVIGTETIAEVARNAGVTPQQLVQRVTAAHATGQPYTVADALGHEGARKLTGMAKVPGAQREEIVDFLSRRNLDLPVQTGAEVGRQLGAQGTAEAERLALLQRARRESAPYFQQAESQPTWSRHIQSLVELEDPVIRQGLQAGLREQRIQAAARGHTFDPLDHVLDAQGNLIGAPNTRTLQTLKIGLDNIIESPAAFNRATGELNRYGQAVNALRQSLVTEMGRVNPAYRQANQLYADPMRTREAIDIGRAMAQGRGRHEDTVPAFRALTAPEQQGVRIGYANDVRSVLERGQYPMVLREKSTKGANELNALAQDPVALREYLNRVETMQSTSQKALGGSSTAENAADILQNPGGAEALGFVTNLMRGNWSGAARTGLEAASRAARGENQAQRSAITRQLLARDPVAAQALADRISALERRRQARPSRTHPYSRLGR